MIIFISLTVHQDNTAQIFILFLFMVICAAPISKHLKLIGIGTDFPIDFLIESQVS